MSSKAAGSYIKGATILTAVGVISENIDSDPMIDFAHEISGEPEVVTEADYEDAEDMSIVDAEDLDNPDTLA